MKKVLIITAITAAGITAAGIIAAGITAIPAGAGEWNFRAAKKAARQIYDGHQTTFYCGCAYAYQGRKGVPDAASCGYKPRLAVTRSGKANARARRIEWEHVMPAWVFGHQRQCWQKTGNSKGGRKACKKDPVFVAMEADLHNLVPAIGELNGDRSNYRFSEIPGEARIYGACDFEVDFKNRRAEPPKQVRGEVARIYFYMAKRYGLRLSKRERLHLGVWHRLDPVDARERQRNRRIKAVQGNGNPFVK